MSRLVIPGLPHHVTQRGVRSLPVFTDDDDRELYLALLRDQADRHGLRFEAWCLMTNHIHLIAIPKREDSLARGIGEAHRLFTRARNFREGVRGYLFQGRFGSYVMDPGRLVRAARYIELNPVRAGLVDRAGDYPWSSAGLHLGQAAADALWTGRRAVEIVGDWAEFLRAGEEVDDGEVLRHLSTGRPLGSGSFIRRLERKTGRPLARRVGGWPKGRPRRPRP